MSFFGIHFLIFEITSVWKPQFNCIWKNFIFHIHTIIFVVPFGLFIIALVLFLLMNDWDIYIFSKNIYLIVIKFVITLQIINLKRQRNKIYEVTEILKIIPFAPENIEEQEIISRYENKNRMEIFLFVVPLMIGTTGLYIARIAKANVPVFPYYIWVPYDLSNTNYYWTTLFFYTSSGIISALIILQFISFFSSATLIIQSQVAILRYRYKKSMEIIEKKYQNRDEMNELEILEKKLIVDFVNNHLEVLKLARIINDIFSIDILFFYSTCTVLICTNAYVASTVPLLSQQFFATVFLGAATICAITIICYSSTGISTAFEKLHAEISSSNWIILSEKTKKSLMIVMIKTQNPFNFTTGKIIQPSRESLKNIAQVVYSLYNLMRESNQ